MVRLAAELLLLLGLLLLTLHITVLRGSRAADRPDGATGNVSGSQLRKVLESGLGDVSSLLLGEPEPHGPLYTLMLVIGASSCQDSGRTESLWEGAEQRFVSHLLLVVHNNNKIC